MGGERIIPYKGIESKQQAVGESWELSGIKGNESVISNGAIAGKTICDILATNGAELIGKANLEFLILPT